MKDSVGPNGPLLVLGEQVAYFSEQGFLSRRLGWLGWLLFFLLLHRVDPLDQHEDSEGNDDKVDHSVDEDAVVERGGTLAFAEGQRQIAEAHASHDHPDRRHDDIGYQR